MIFCTSISPTHANGEIQKKTIESWLKLCGKVFSFNCEKEIEILKSQYPKVKFIPIKKTGEYYFGKPYIYINDIFDWFEEKCDLEILCLINSDIYLSHLPEQIKTEAQESIIISNRYDYTGE